MSKVVIKTYLHNCKENNIEKADELGLTGKAFSKFLYHASEVCLEYELDTETGKTTFKRFISG